MPPSTSSRRSSPDRDRYAAAALNDLVAPISKAPVPIAEAAEILGSLPDLQPALTRRSRDSPTRVVRSRDMTPIVKTLQAVVVAVGLTLSASSCGEPVGEAAPFNRPAAWSTYRDAERGLSVSLPSDWHRARQSLTPSLVEPREILSIGSYPLRYQRRSRCHVPSCPVPAIDGLGRGDVLVSIQERRGSGAYGFPAQRRPFQLDPMRLSFPAGRSWTCAKRRLARAFWTPFAASGRGFYAFVAFGRGVTRQTRRDVVRVLDSLRFDRKPFGRSLQAAGPRSVEEPVASSSGTR